MLYPCQDYYRGVPHAPHDWDVYDATTVECPGKFDEGGSAAVSANVVPAPSSGPG